MAFPSEQILLVTENGEPVQIDELIERLQNDQSRILADDEIGIIAYVGDLGIYNLKPTSSGEFLAQHVTEISRPRFSTRILRRQIGAAMLSVTSDAVFIIRDGGKFRKVRAEKLEPGMVLASGEKVYQ
jgi:hypothetical protein